MKISLLLISLLFSTLLFSQASIALIKVGTFNDENSNGCAEVGETISYSFSVSNTGTEAFTEVIVDDPLAPVVVSGGPITLDPGEIDDTTFTAFVQLTQQDIDAGLFENQAVANGTTSSGDEVSDLSDDNSFLEDDPTVIVFCILGIDDHQSSSLFTYYPNPAVNKIQFELATEVDHAIVKLYNVVGVEIANKVVTSENNSLDVSLLSSGTYFVTVLIEDKLLRFTLLKD